MNNSNITSPDNSFSQSNSINYSLLAQKIIEEINTARNFPASYSKRLQHLLQNSQEDNFIIGDSVIRTKEGIKGLSEAISFLKSFKVSLEQLLIKNGLQELATDQQNSLIVHDGIDMNLNNKLNSDLQTKANKYGKLYGEFNEIIKIGDTSDPFQIVLNIILSDGDFTRKERRMIFSKNIRYIGVSCGELPSGRINYGIYLAEFYYEKNEFIPNSVIQKFSNNTPINIEKENGLTNHFYDASTSKTFKKSKFEKKVIKPVLNIETEKVNLNDNPVIKINISPENNETTQNNLTYTISPVQANYLKSSGKPEDLSFKLTPKDMNFNKTNTKTLNTITLKPTEFEMTIKSFNMDNSIQPLNDIIKEDDYSKTMKNYSNFNFEEDFEELPEGIERVEIREKPINKEDKKFFVKKTIYYSNGVSETFYFQK
jgi:hypothetical protein